MQNLYGSNLVNSITVLLSTLARFNTMILQHFMRLFQILVQDD